MRCVGEELGEVLEEAGGSVLSVRTLSSSLCALTKLTPPLSREQFVCRLLEPIIETLTTVTETLPYTAALPLITSLSQAVELSASSPSSPSPISSLPTELFSRIVHFCQDDDLRLRQNTNIALAHTCRPFYLAVKPVLEAEVHLFTAGQLMRFADAMDKRRRFKRNLRRFTLSIPPSQLEREGNGEKWAGLRVLPLLEKLGSERSLSVLTVDFHTSSPLRRFGSEDDDNAAVVKALGEKGDSWWRALHLTTGEIPDIDLSAYPLADGEHFCPVEFLFHDSSESSGRKHLRIGAADSPHLIQPQNARCRLRPSGRSLQAVYEERHHCLSSLLTLAIPFFAFHLSDFLPLILSKDTAAPLPHRHLEVTLFFENLDDDLPLLRQLIAVLPSLRHLTLRLRKADSADSDAERVVSALIDSLAANCPSLETFELGGDPVNCDAFYLAPEKLPSLRHLTILPCGEAFEFSEIEFVAGRLPSHIETFTVVHSGVDKRDLESECCFAEASAACEARVVEFRLRPGKRETEWLETEMS
jgi:hypothetical protein